MTTAHRTRELPQAILMAQVADEDRRMPTEDDIDRIAREHQLSATQAQALVRFADAVSRMDRTSRGGHHLEDLAWSA